MDFKMCQEFIGIVHVHVQVQGPVHAAGTDFYVLGFVCKNFSTENVHRFSTSLEDLFTGTKFYRQAAPFILGSRHIRKYRPKTSVPHPPFQHNMRDLYHISPPAFGISGTYLMGFATAARPPLW
eukprot:2789559-Karenia_brevis.AAC.1